MLPFVYETDYEDNKMKKDTLATLHSNINNHILTNLHINISNVLNYSIFYEYLTKNYYLIKCNAVPWRKIILLRFCR